MFFYRIEISTTNKETTSLHKSVVFLAQRKLKWKEDKNTAKDVH
jgi:hypothetical protein